MLNILAMQSQRKIIFAQNLRKMNTLSVVIITFNEEQKIGQCLDSVKDIANEIIVVDSHSTDATEAVCLQYGAKFFLQDWLGYSDQKNLADGLATCDLIFSIDADEALSDELKTSIATLKTKEIAENEVFAMNRLNNYCGQWIKGCGLYPETKVRIWRRGFAQWEGIIHEWLNYKSEPKKTLLKGDLLHYSWDTPEAFRKQQFHFAELGAQSYYERSKKTGLLPYLFSPGINFIRTYIIKGGFLYGKTGFSICRTMMQANRHKYNLLREKIRQNKT